MKKFILILAAVCAITYAEAQDKLKKVEVIEFYANGQCGSCETRINSALDVKGIKLGSFDSDTQTVKVVYKTKKISEDQIHQIIADLGYDTEKAAANQDARTNLPGCCVGGKHDGKKDCDL